MNSTCCWLSAWTLNHHSDQVWKQQSIDPHSHQVQETQTHLLTHTYTHTNKCATVGGAIKNLPKLTNAPIKPAQCDHLCADECDLSGSVLCDRARVQFDWPQQSDELPLYRATTLLWEQSSYNKTPPPNLHHLFYSFPFLKHTLELDINTFGGLFVWVLWINATLQQLTKTE